MPTRTGSIVVPLDGSELSERVLPLALEIASRSGVSIVFVSVPQLGDAEVSVFADYQIRLSDAMPPAAMERLSESLLEETRAYVEQIARSCTGRGISAEIVVRETDPAEAIIDAASERGRSMIVMATHGRSGLGRWAFGSVAERVLHAAPGPLLLVPAAADHLVPVPRRILVPLDGSAAGEEVLSAASSFAQLFEATLELAHVLPPFDDLVRAGLGEVMALERRYETWLRSYFERVADRLRDDRVEVDTIEIAGPDIADALLAQAARDEIDLLALTTRAFDQADRWTLGSVASRVIGSTRTPVLLVRVKHQT